MRDAERASNAMRMLVLFAACVAFALIQFDVTVVNVALPGIGVALKSGPAKLAWVVDSYVLVFASAMMLGGMLGDRYGLRQTFHFGMAVFAGASIGCAVAWNIQALVIFRALQGGGAALLMPACLALIRTIFADPAARARAIGLWGVAGGAATAAGPVLGGAVVTLTGWRGIFWLNIPLILLSIGALALTRAGETKKADVRLNVLNMACASLALSGIVTGLIEAGAHGWRTPLAIELFAGGLLAAVVFWRLESTSRRPVVPAALRGCPSYLCYVSAALVGNFGFYGAIFLLSFYWQTVLGLSPLEAGMRFLPLTLQVLVTSVLASRWVASDGSATPIVCGLALSTVGYIGLSLDLARGSEFLHAMTLLATGTGMVIAITGLTAGVLSRAGAEHAATASAIFSTARQVGSAAGVAVSALLIAPERQLLVGMQLAMMLAGALNGAAAIMVWATRSEPILDVNS